MSRCRTNDWTRQPSPWWSCTCKCAVGAGEIRESYGIPFTTRQLSAQDPNRWVTDAHSRMMNATEIWPWCEGWEWQSGRHMSCLPEPLLLHCHHMPRAPFPFRFKQDIGESQEIFQVMILYDTKKMSIQLDLVTRLTSGLFREVLGIGNLCVRARWEKKNLPLKWGQKSLRAQREQQVWVWQGIQGLWAVVTGVCCDVCCAEARKLVCGESHEHRSNAYHIMYLPPSCPQAGSTLSSMHLWDQTSFSGNLLS